MKCNITKTFIDWTTDHRCFDRCIEYAYNGPNKAFVRFVETIVRNRCVILNEIILRGFLLFFRGNSKDDIRSNARGYDLGAHRVR